MPCRSDRPAPDATGSRHGPFAVGTATMAPEGCGTITGTAYAPAPPPRYGSNSPASGSCPACWQASM
jgi:hypothetical protein